MDRFNQNKDQRVKDFAWHYWQAALAARREQR
jgi:hypothetical protein